MTKQAEGTFWTFGNVLFLDIDAGYTMCLPYENSWCYKSFY